MKQIEEQCVNTLRFLAADAVERAGSGHPGMPMGAAPMAFALWDRFLKHNPANPRWCDRDRFVLSAGHGSALLYGLLHLTGYDLPLEELRRLRQWSSRTPGHPEHGLTPGVEATTGPLGQGFGMAVGMAMAERYLADTFNTERHRIVDHFTYVIASDGDLMEGVCYESSSLAGHLGLGKLIAFYDENRVTIDGSADLAFSDDITARFEALGWHVHEVGDGNDVEAISLAIEAARREATRPSLIRVHTHIGFGSMKQDTAAAHGEPLGADVLRGAKECLEWPTSPAFLIPEEVGRHFRRAVERGADAEAEWRRDLEAYRADHPRRAARFLRMLDDVRPEGWADALPAFGPEDGPLATRRASSRVMAAFADALPEVIGGSGDLASSNKTKLDEYDSFRKGASGRNIHYGVREHAMGTATNGMALHGGLRPFASTFLIFTDYMRPAIRLAALMEARSIFVLTHDSIGLGGDGPTHQPVEHLISLRAMPNLRVIRPADANETVTAWRMALEHHGPTALILTRQDVPILPLAGTHDYGVDAEGVARGAYVIADTEGVEPDVIILATGSEVHVALEARRKLRHEDLHARVVSMPCWEVFAEQSQEYRDRVLPPGIRARVAVEAAAPHGWREWVGESGLVMGVRRFGSSAPGEEVLRNHGFTPELVADVARAATAGSASLPV